MMVDWNVDKLFYDCSVINGVDDKDPFEPVKIPALPRPPPSTDDIHLSQAFKQPFGSQSQRTTSHFLASSQNDTRCSLPTFTKKTFPSSRIGVVNPSTITSQRLTSSFKTPYKPSSSQISRPVDLDNGEDVNDVNEDFFPSQQLSKTPSYLQPTLQPFNNAITPIPLQVQGSVHGNLNLKPRSEIPEEYHDIFDFPYFNAVQSKVFEDVLYSDKALVVCAPTGSGKTVLFELAIIRLLLLQKSQQFEAKVIYMAPVKALCSERYEDWNNKFGRHGMKCMELTGDTDMDSYFDLQNVNIIFTTPEKWDSMTRRWRDNKSMVQYVRLFLIDEVHLLTEDSRGATMEAVVSRMKTVQAASTSHHDQTDPTTHLRFVAVSATIPNVEDVAGWLSTSESPAIYHKMDESLRPVRLRKVVLGFHCSDSTSEFKFDITLNYKLASVIETYSNKKPTLVFCATRKSVMQGAATLSKEAKFILNAQHKIRLQDIANAIKDSKLRDLIMGGIAYHHAGLDMNDRKTVETGFSNGDIPVLLATSTLAMGVNLPAHLVIIKSTMHYVMGCYQEYPESQIQQMIGRAGRPQFDTSATGVIMTRMSTKHKYDAVISGTQMIESSLHKSLIEHLNAEIVLNTISDVTVALQWLKSTFLFIRVMKNPKHYGIPTGLKQEQVDQKLQDLCLTNLRQLSDIDLVKIEQEQLIPTDSGRLMARYCVAFETMKNFSKLEGTESMEEVLRVFCNSEEFHDVQLRVNEKRVLNMLNKDKNHPTIRYTLNGKIKSVEMKVNCLIQTSFGSLSLQEFSLQQDTNKIFKAAKRVTRCLVEVLWMKKRNFQLLLNAVLLDKCVNARLWENSKHVSRQLTGIGPAISNALVNQGLVSFDKLEKANPRDIELIVNRHAPFGSHVHEAVAGLPKYRLHVEQTTPYSANQCELTISVDILNKDAVNRKPTAHKSHQCSLLIGDTSGEVLLKTRISDGILLRSGPWTKKITAHRAEAGEDLSIHLISQDWVGIDITSSYTPVYTGPKRLVATLTRGETTQAEEVRAAVALAEGHRPCNHKCQHKEACGHDCCKIGIPVKTTPMQRAVQDMKNRLKDFQQKPTGTVKNEPSSGQLQSFAYTPKKFRMPIAAASGWGQLDLHQFTRQAVKGTTLHIEIKLFIVERLNIYLHQSQ